MAWIADYSAELSRRGFALQRYNADKKLRAAADVYYKTRPVEWIEDFCLTYDPRRKGIKWLPFLLFPKQKQFIEFLEACRTTGNSGLGEKCRDAGLTWLCVCYSVWCWLYVPGSAMGFGSRKQDLVDKIGDPKSIFEKVRQVVRNLPWWQLPQGYVPRLHCGFMKLINPATGATITGEAGDAIGRGGRTTMYFKDEAAHYEHAESIEAALGDNTDVQIDISSVNGTGNVFYRRRKNGQEWAPGREMTKGKVWVFIFEWRDDPRKSQDWYDTRRARYESEGLLHIFAQEVDRDYSGSQERILIKTEWIEACVDAHIILGFPAQGAKIAAQDVADGGYDKNAMFARHGVVATYCESWGGEAQEAAKKAIPICISLSVEQLYYDSIGVGVGFKAESNTMRRNGAVPPGLKIFPWDAASSVTNPESRLIPNDPQSPKNIDHFDNLKAQGWWSLRTRCYKTYRAVRFGEKYPADELISLPSQLPNRHQLMLEMAQPTYDYTKAGKMFVNKTPDETSSPNEADACMMCYHPAKPPRGLLDL